VNICDKFHEDWTCIRESTTSINLTNKQNQPTKSRDHNSPLAQVVKLGRKKFFMCIVL